MSETKKGDSPKKHKLQNEWTLWLVEYDPLTTWEDMLRKTDTFGTVEDFWNLYFRIDPPSKLKKGCDYMLFKKNIPPMWEDPANRQGGRWAVFIQKGHKTDLDIIWLDVLLCLIGEAAKTTITSVELSLGFARRSIRSPSGRRTTKMRRPSKRLVANYEKSCASKAAISCSTRRT